jgi:hypothetical protein
LESAGATEAELQADRGRDGTARACTAIAARGPAPRQLTRNPALSEAPHTVPDMADELGAPGTWPYPPAAERKAQAWAAGASPQEGVGTRHHTVPAFYLRYFADGEQLLVRRIPEHQPMLCNLRDLAQKDFYTVITDDPDGGQLRPDGRIEQVLRIVEGNAATVLNRLRNPLLVRRPPTQDERGDLAQFISFQLARGVRKRREIELLAEYHLKLTAGGRADGAEDAPTLEELARVRLVPHPNEHLAMFGLGGRCPRFGWTLRCRACSRRGSAPLRLSRRVPRESASPRFAGVR